MHILRIDYLSWPILKSVPNIYDYDCRKQLLENATKHMDKNGLNTLKYKVQTRLNLDLYTQIDVNVEMTEKEKEMTSLRELEKQSNTDRTR